MAESTENKPPIKHDWYQTETAVVITVLVKNTKEEHLQVSFADTEVQLRLKSPETSDEHTLKYSLAHSVVPEQCSYKITPSKIEIKLKKRDGIRWDKLEGDPTVKVPLNIPTEAKFTEGPPSYPTSKKGKDWSAIEREIKAEEAQEKPEGDEALNKLFQDIYGKGSDEVKKAMNKSYLESGGTVLSTNWNEISKDKVKVQPPDGLEWKKWN